MLIRAAAWMLLVIATGFPSIGSVFATPTPFGPGNSPEPASAAVTTAPTPPPDSTPLADSTPPADTTPPVTVNDFLPVDRNIGDCISALPKPGCGSEARGGWGQTAVFGSIVLGISFIVWRIVLSSRRAKRQQQGASS